MSIPKAAHPVVCDLCGMDVNPIMARYLFLAAGWRGRPIRKPNTTTKVVFCGPCGDIVLGAIQPYLRNGVTTQVTT